MGAEGPLMKKWFSGGELFKKTGYFEGTIKLAVMIAGFLYPTIGNAS